MSALQRLASTALPAEDVLDHGPAVFSFAANDDYIVLSLTDRTVHALSSRTGALLHHPHLYRHPGSFVSGLVLHDNHVVLTSADSSELTVVALSSGTVSRTLACPHPRPIYRLQAAVPDGSTVLAFHMDGSACVWDVGEEAAAHRRTLAAHEGSLAHASVIAGGRLLTCAPDGTVAACDWRGTREDALLWRRTVGEAEGWREQEEDEEGARTKRIGSAAFAVAISEGRALAATRDGVVWMWDLESGTELARWTACDGMTQHLIPRGDRLVQVSWGELKIWQTGTQEPAGAVRLFDRACEELVLVNGYVVACGRDASQASDRCGLDYAVKGWKICWEGKVGTNEKEAADHADVFNIGMAVRAARGLASLGDDRVCFAVLRGSKWVVEIWQVQGDSRHL